MRAKCPYCQDGCDRCEGGYTTVSIKEGTVWTKQCLNHEECGFANGGRVSDEEPEDPSPPCVICGELTDWVPLELTTEGEPAYEAYRQKYSLAHVNSSCEALRREIRDLRNIVRQWPELQKRSLSREEARLLGVCQVCKKPGDPPTRNVFDANAGFGHKDCLGIEE